MYWNEIKAAENRIRAIEVRWRQTSTAAQPQFNAAKGVEDATAQMKMHDPSAAGTEQFRRNMELVSNSLQSGHTSTSTLAIQSNGIVTRGEVFADVLGEPDKTAHSLDVFDGRNNISVLGFGTANPVQGQLNRDPAQRHHFFAPGHARPLLYFAAPLTNEFPPETTVVTKTADNTVTLEHMLPYSEPMSGKLVLSKEHWRPLEFTIENPANHKVLWRCVLSGYRSYADGIYFPAEISQVLMDARGTAVTSGTLSLESVKFNDDVDKTVFDQPVPIGTNIADFRFGAPGVSYRLSGAIPSDAEVQAFLKARTDAERQHRPPYDAGH